MTAPVRVCFVCLGNICRSPTAEGIFIRKVAEAGLAGVIDIDSAGTHGYHIGEAPDPRTQSAALRRGYGRSLDFALRHSILTLLALAGTVALSRMNDNKHYLHDVVAGATIGTAYGLGIYFRRKKWL